LLASVCYPDAGYPQLRVCSDFLAYFFYLDNLTDDMDDGSTRHLADYIMKSLDDPHFRSHYRICKMTADYFRRIKQTSSLSIQKRFRDTMENFLISVDRQAQDRLKGYVPNLQSYISHRRDTSGCKTCFVLIEYANNLRIPDEILSTSHIQAMQEATNDVISFANDVFSFKIEHSKADNHNLVAVLIHEHPEMCTLDAIQHVCQRTGEAMARFNSLKFTLPSWGPTIDKDIACYIAGLESWMIGVFYWSFQTERYFGKDVRTVRASRTVTFVA